MAEKKKSLSKGAGSNLASQKEPKYIEIKDPCPTETRDYYFRKTWIQTIINGGLVLALIISLLFNYALGTREVEREYFGQNSKGDIIKLTPLSEPYHGPSAVLQFTYDCIKNSVNLDYINYEKQISDVESCYSRQGYEYFINGIRESGLARDIVKYEILKETIVTDMPRITSEGYNKRTGAWEWVIEGKISSKFHSRTPINGTDETFRVIVTRQFKLRNEYGLAIRSIVFKRN